jgi:nucleoside-diphosphate-sugar epimerase
VHITDTADLYTLVYTKALQEDLSSGSNGYHLGCAGDYDILDISTAIAEEMVQLGLAQTPELRQFSPDDQRYRVIFTGTNARGIAERSFALGWRPKYDEKSHLLDYIKDEVRTMARERAGR